MNTKSNEAGCTFTVLEFQSDGEVIWREGGDAGQDLKVAVKKGDLAATDNYKASEGKHHYWVYDHKAELVLLNGATVKVKAVYGDWDEMCKEDINWDVSPAFN